MGKKTMPGVFLAALLVLTAGPALGETVKVGMIVPFSGPFARWGEQFKMAVAVYQKQHGTSVNGNEIKVIFRDSGGPAPARSRQLSEELILREKVQFLAGYAFTPNVLAVADLATQARVPVVITNAATGIITRKSPYFVRVSMTIPQIAFPIAQWAVKNGVKTAITMVSDYGPGVDGEKYYIKHFTAGGGKILESIRVPLSVSDYSPFFERVRQAKPDGLFVFAPGGPPTVGFINTWAKRLKPIGIRFFATAETQEIDLPKIGPSALGVISSYHYTETQDNALNRALWKDLGEMFGPNAIPENGLVQTYDGMHMIYETVRKLGPRPDPEAAMKFLSNMAFESPRGPISIDPKTRDIVQNIYLRKVEMRDGKLRNVNFDVLPNVKDPWKEDNPE